MKWPTVFVMTGLSMWCCISMEAQYHEGDWEFRDSWMNVERIFRWAGVQAGDQVADIGSHEGYLSMHLARMVGPAGQVWAVDINADHLKALRGHASERRLHNIRTVVGSEDNPRLPQQALDLIFVMDSYHEMDDYMGMLSHFFKALKPGGRLVILEKLKDYAKNRDRDAQANAHTLAPEFVKDELERAGFEVMREIEDLGYWENEKDKTMWLLIANVPKA